jgi:hypothetical protein
MGWMVNATPRPLYPRYSLYRWLDGPQGQSGWVRKILPPPGLDPRTVQPVAIHYANYVFPAHSPYYTLVESVGNLVLCSWVYYCLSQ